MRKASVAVLWLFTILLLVLSTSCKKDSPTEPSPPSLCFTVSGFNVSPNNQLSDGIDVAPNVTTSFPFLGDPVPGR